MDQEKIGKFIATQRKQHGMTQSDLAEKLGVSHKTVSRWECGKGLPEISLFTPLCEILNVSINELFSGEQISQDTYTQKAEENILSLIQENEEYYARNRFSWIFSILFYVVLFAIVWLIMYLGGITNLISFDVPSLMMIAVPSIILLCASGLLRSFGEAFFLIFCKEPLPQKTNKAIDSIKTLRGFIIPLGALESSLQIFAVFFINSDALSPTATKNIAVSMLTLIYALIIYIVLIPVDIKLRSLQS
ncbi:MAG: helix-turn-helix domain-containing protein [Butyrivibrio sp.]|nr:helix-turn-helix domain-containing protein [Butyrivibrio sp.]